MGSTIQIDFMKTLLRKLLKFTLFFLLALFITVNLFVILCGRFYLYKGIANTYLVGETGPTIYDLDVFPYTTIKKGTSDEVLHASLYNNYKLTDEDRAYLEGLETRAFLVYKGDSLIFEEYWDGHEENTVSNSFSVAKTVVALLISIAVEEGKIESLDEPVANYIPEFKSGGREVITIRHLLAMSSGLDWEESGKNPLSDNAESYYGDHLYELVTSQKLVREPGELFLYQSGNSQLLGYVVEKATGMDLSTYAQEKLWSKIGMEHDAFWSLDKEKGDEKAFCCLYSTARDFGRIGQLIHHRGKYNKEEIFPLWFYNEMISPTGLGTEDGIANSRYGLHIWTYPEEVGQVNYCRGIKGQYIISIPEDDIVIIRVGEEREKNIELDRSKKGNIEYMLDNHDKIGHAACLFEYLRIGRKIVNN